MAAKSSIEWTDASWTPIRARVRADAKQIAETKGYTSLLPILDRVPAGKVGPHCEHVSPGCEHCYSETGNGRCLTHNGTGLPFDRRARDLVDIFLDEGMLRAPLKWRKPRKVFVCSQTDLFADFVTDEMIDRVFAVMALCPQHTFQVLTKRSERMRRYFNNDSLEDRLTDLWAGDDPNKETWNLMLPLKNVHLGVSVENQEYADKRIPDLLMTPAAVRWVSYEPALGPIDFDDARDWLIANEVHRDNAMGSCMSEIDWIVIGGESGSGARPLDIALVRQTIEQCRAARVPVFVKQLGAKPVIRTEDLEPWPNGSTGRPGEWAPALRDRKGGDITEWPEDLRMREFPA